MDAPAHGGRRVLAPLLLVGGLVAAATLAQAGIQWVSTGVFSLGTTAPPVELGLGAGGEKARYFSALALSANKTQLSGTLLGRAGADLVVMDVVRVTNTAASPQSVTLSATGLSNAQLEVFAWTLRDGGATVGTLAYTDASPALSFTLPAGESRTLDLRIDLADGAGAHNAALDFDLRVVVG